MMMKTVMGWSEEDRNEFGKREGRAIVSEPKKIREE